MTLGLYKVCPTCQNCGYTVHTDDTGAVRNRACVRCDRKCVVPATFPAALEACELLLIAWDTGEISGDVVAGGRFLQSLEKAREALGQKEQGG